MRDVLRHVVSLQQAGFAEAVEDVVHRSGIFKALPEMPRLGGIWATECRQLDRHRNLVLPSKMAEARCRDQPCLVIVRPLLQGLARPLDSRFVTMRQQACARGDSLEYLAPRVLRTEQCASLQVAKSFIIFAAVP